MRINTNKIYRILLYVVILVEILFFLFPLYWGIITSLKPNVDIYEWPPRLLPSRFTLEHYVNVLSRGDVLNYLKNSFIIASSVSLITIVVSSLAGYSLSRSHFTFKRNLRVPILMTYMFPSIVLAIPMFRIFVQAGLMNTHLGLILAHLTLTTPFATLLMWPYFDSIPRELDEAALVDGASRIRCVFSIMLPVALPGTLAIAILSFITSWNEFTFALFLGKQESVKTISVGLSFLAGSDVMIGLWTEVMALCVISTLPTLILFLLIQKRFLEAVQI